MNIQQKELFMKKVIKMLGIIAIMALIWFSFAACGDESSGDLSSPSGGNNGGGTNTPVGEKPSAPRNFKVIPDTHNTLKLEWTSPSASGGNAEGYYIYRSTSSTTAYTKIKTIAVGSNSFTDTVLSSNTRYYYRITAYNGAGESTYSSNGNMTAVLAGTTRETAIQIVFDWAIGSSNPRIYYFPSGTTELWLYFENTGSVSGSNKNYIINFWDKNYTGNYYTGVPLVSWYIGASTTAGVNGLATAHDTAAGDGRRSVHISVAATVAERIYLKINTSSASYLGTFAMGVNSPQQL